MDLSPVGEAVLIAREGRRLTAYRDAVGVWTIGAGVTSASGLIRVTPGLTLTAAECDALTRRAFAQYAGHVEAAIGDIALAQHEYDALVSFCFNVGPGNFRKSGVLRLLKAGDRKGAGEALLQWGKPAAVITRRQAERDQFFTPYAVRMPAARRGERPLPVPGRTGTARRSTPREPRPPAPRLPASVPPASAVSASTPCAPPSIASPARPGPLARLWARLRGRA